MSDRRMPVPGVASIRAGSGLGDALYLQGVVRHLVLSRGQRLEVCTKWPEVFRPLAGRVQLSPFRRDCTILAHYARRRHVAGSDQWQDSCIAAGIAEPVELRLDWTVANPRLVEKVRGAAAGRPIVLVMMAREPMARADNFAIELLPDCRVIQRAIDRIGERALLVQVGRGEALFRFRGIGLDLANRTSVADLLDVAAVAHGALGYCGFVIPLMEGFRRPGLLVWSRRGLQSKTDLIRRLTPEKVIHRRDLLRTVIDDCAEDELARGVNAVLDACRGAAPV